jgi:hypothetical protein
MTRTHCAVPIVLFVLLLDAISRGTARRVLVRRFPYFVIYREWSDRLEIVAVAHQSRRPGYWRSRGS